jgi:hypothetical protein
MLLNVDYKIVTNIGNYLFGTVRICISFTVQGMNTMKVIKRSTSKNHPSLLGHHRKIAESWCSSMV